MPPPIALAIVLGAILFLLARERRMNPDVSGALWIPFLWMFFIGTRFPTQWLDMGGASMQQVDDYLDGSPVDRAVYLALFAAALVVLIRRHVSWSSLAATNFWIVAFFAYGLASVAWSEFPWVAFKRFAKVAEHVVMVLVVVTEPNLRQAMDALLRRFLALGVLLSVLFLKYYPEYGRAFDYWTGQPYNMGATLDKNALGHICVIGAIFYSSSLLSRAHRAIAQPAKGRALLDIGMLGAVFWLLDIANAKTALVCSLLGILSVAVLTRTRLGRSPKAVLATVLSLVVLFAVLEAAFDIRQSGIEALGRDATLTDRTFVWDDVLAVPNNVVLGTGFESFWLGPRAEQLWEKYWWHPNQAHNGYIETYINLGVIGLVLLVAMMAAAFFRSLQSMRDGDPFGAVRFALIVAIVILNYTDATFKALHILYFTFLLMAVAPVRRRDRALAGSPGAAAAKRRPVGSDKPSFRMPGAADDARSVDHAQGTRRG
jgi:O-antigen ligase